MNDEEIKEFEKLFEKVARWVATEYGVDSVLKITAANPTPSSCRAWSNLWTKN